MIQALDSGCYTVLQLMLARGLFIGDEVRVASLRIAWNESGQPQEAFGVALNQLQQDALIKLGHSKAGPVAQLSKHGFALGQQKRQAPLHTERRRSMPGDNPTSHRRRRVEHVLPAPQAKTPGASPESPPKSPIGLAHARSRVTHGSVFASQADTLSPNALQMCVLGVLRNHGIGAHEQLDYAHVLQDWLHMQLPQDDLLLAIKRLSDQREIEAISHPRERLLLTRRGYQRYENMPANLEEGMDRWQARKYLRATKRLGRLPAA